MTPSIIRQYAGGGARAQRLVDAIAITDALDEREAVRELQTDFDALDAVTRRGIGRGRSAHRILGDRCPFCAHTAAIEQGDDLLHLLVERVDMLGLCGLRERWVDETSAVGALVRTIRRSAGACPSAPNTPPRNSRTTATRAAVVEDEGRKARRLIDAPADAHAGQRDDRGGQFHRQRDRPLALVVARPGRALARQQLDVVEHGLPVERLTDVMRPWPSTLMEPSQSR